MVNGEQIFIVGYMGSNTLNRLSDTALNVVSMVNYNFLTIWRFDAPLEDVYEVIRDADKYHLWWKGQSPVETIRNGNGLGVGTVKRFRTRSVLPYSLVYDGTVLDVEPLKKIEGKTVGDLKGHGIWLFEKDNDHTVASYYWNVKTEVGWMNKLAPVLKPVFEWNHDVVMRWGAEGLARYLGCELIRE